MKTENCCEGVVPGPVLYDMGGTPVSILLPDGERPSSKVMGQLAAFAAAAPDGGPRPEALAATPDLHPGSPVPVGCVLATRHDVAVPAAVGNDSGCGMRLVSLGITRGELDVSAAGLRAALSEAFVECRRDIPADSSFFRGLFGLPGDELGSLFEGVPRGGLWLSPSLSRERMATEASATAWLADCGSSADRAPDALVGRRGELRDPSLGTLGSGNHFLEIGVVSELRDRKAAWAMGLRTGGLCALAHTGSRDLGFLHGSFWRDEARRAHPAGRPFPDSGIFALGGGKTGMFLDDVGAACRYGWLNRALLAEMLFAALAKAGVECAPRLVLDAPHNYAALENGVIVHRKGANRAAAGDPVVIPGSMGDGAWVCLGAGAGSLLSSCSHGSGRVLRRGAAASVRTVGGAQFDCLCGNPRRAAEEAPEAYRQLEPVVAVQERAGLLTRVAKIDAILTIKA